MSEFNYENRGNELFGIIFGVTAQTDIATYLGDFARIVKLNVTTDAHSQTRFEVCFDVDCSEMALIDHRINGFLCVMANSADNVETLAARNVNADNKFCQFTSDSPCIKALIEILNEPMLDINRRNTEAFINTFLSGQLYHATGKYVEVSGGCCDTEHLFDSVEVAVGLYDASESLAFKVPVGSAHQVLPVIINRNELSKMTIRDAMRILEHNICGKVTRSARLPYWRYYNFETIKASENEYLIASLTSEMSRISLNSNHIDIMNYWKEVGYNCDMSNATRSEWDEYFENKMEDLNGTETEADIDELKDMIVMEKQLLSALEEYCPVASRDAPWVIARVRR